MAKICYMRTADNGTDRKLYYSDDFVHIHVFLGKDYVTLCEGDVIVTRDFETVVENGVCELYIKKGY